MGTEHLANVLKDKAKWEENTHVFADGKEDFAITVNGREYLDRKEGAKALAEAVSAKNRAGFQGAFKGFRLRCNVDFLTKQPYVSLTYANTHRVDVYGRPSALMGSIEGIKGKIDSEVRTAQMKLEQLRHSMEVAKEELERPFPHEERLRQLEERAEELKAIFQAREKGLTDEADIAREVRLSRIRGILEKGGIDFEKLPPEQEARRFLLEAAEFLENHEEGAFPTDEALMQNMFKEGWEAEACVAVLEKYSPNCTRRETLIRLAEKHEQREPEVACAVR